MKKANNKKNTIYRCAAVLLWLFVWQAAAMALDQPLILPSPLSVIRQLFVMLKDASFYRTVAFSFSHITLGALMGMALGMLLAFAAARSKAVAFLLQPLIVTVRTVPVASFIILAFMFLSSRELSVFISFLMVLPIMYANLLEGLTAIPREMLEMASMYRLSPIRRLMLIDLPHVKPHLLSGAATALGMAWKSGVAAEVIGISMGSIGGNLYQSKAAFEAVTAYAWTAVIMVVSILFEKAVLFLIRYGYRRLERL